MSEPRLKSLDLSDIEDGGVAEHCFACRKKQYKFQRVGTKNQVGVCLNKDCFRYENPSESPSWVRVE